MPSSWPRSALGGSMPTARSRTRWYSCKEEGRACEQAGGHQLACTKGVQGSGGSTATTALRQASGSTAARASHPKQASQHQLANLSEASSLLLLGSDGVQLRNKGMGVAASDLLRILQVA